MCTFFCMKLKMKDMNSRISIIGNKLKILLTHDSCTETVCQVLMFNGRYFRMVYLNFGVSQNYKCLWISLKIPLIYYFSFKFFNTFICLFCNLLRMFLWSLGQWIKGLSKKKGKIKTFGAWLCVQPLASEVVLTSTTYFMGQNKFSSIYL